MEKTSENFVTDTPSQHHDEQAQDRPRKKKPGPMQVIKVALLRVRKKRSSESPKSLQDVDDNGSKSKSDWRKLVGSMRPMHLQETQSPRSSPRINDGDGDQQNITIPPSPSEYNTDGGDGSLYSPSPASSKYASAVGLNEMVQGDEEGEIKQENDDNNNVVDARVSDGDEMIDAKADEFIANFYNQMKLQRMDTMDRLCKERNQRSLGW